MLNSVRHKSWQKTQLWGLYKTQDGSEGFGRCGLDSSKVDALPKKGKLEPFPAREGSL